MILCYFSKLNLLLTVLILIKKAEPLRAQESPCYEFLCGQDPSYLCGSDGVSYLNGCIYSQAQCRNSSLYVVTTGQCKKDQEAETGIVVEGPTTEAVELETEGLVLETSTMLMSGVEVSSPVAPEDPCMDTFCPSRYNPVCGSDGITYKNRCQFTKAQCRTPGLEFKHEGRCKSFENCLTRICPMREESLCSNTGVTYRNLCELSIAKCYNPELAPVSNGPCPPEATTSNMIQCESEGCSDEYRPICATNGQTYPNICYFNNAKCRNAKLKIYKFEPC